jgi:hypothetical protein
MLKTEKTAWMTVSHNLQKRKEETMMNEYMLDFLKEQDTERL